MTNKPLRHERRHHRPVNSSKLSMSSPGAKPGIHPIQGNSSALPCEPGRVAHIRCKAGLDYYNHNLDTSPEYYGEIITTRNYQDRLDTLANVCAAGIRVCCGGIVGMGERRTGRRYWRMPPIGRSSPSALCSTCECRPGVTTARRPMRCAASWQTRSTISCCSFGPGDWKRVYLPPQRTRSLKRLGDRLGIADLQHALSAYALLDMQPKGALRGDAWKSLERILVALAGRTRTLAGEAEYLRYPQRSGFDLH